MIWKALIGLFGPMVCAPESASRLQEAPPVIRPQVLAELRESAAEPGCPPVFPLYYQEEFGRFGCGLSGTGAAA